jgi:hypothetical protein
VFGDTEHERDLTYLDEEDWAQVVSAVDIAISSNVNSRLTRHLVINANRHLESAQALWARMAAAHLAPPLRFLGKRRNQSAAPNQWNDRSVTN